MSNLWEDDVMPGATGRDCEMSLICLCVCREKGVSPDVIQLSRESRHRVQISMETSLHTLDSSKMLLLSGLPC